MALVGRSGGYGLAALALATMVCASCGADASPDPLAIRPTGTVQGQVTSRDSTRVAQARLTLSAGGTETVADTDAGGVYTFETVVPATWTLEITLSGAWSLDSGQAKMRTVVVRPEEVTREDFILVRQTP